MDVIYVCPVELTDDVYQYYSKLLAMKADGDVKGEPIENRYKIVVPAAVHRFPVSVLNVVESKQNIRELEPSGWQDNEAVVAIVGAELTGLGRRGVGIYELLVFIKDTVLPSYSFDFRLVGSQYVSRVNSQVQPKDSSEVNSIITCIELGSSALNIKNMKTTFE